ncbi:hypothetical protein DL767_008398 [Monosporascus sp. MG133]|nr:hypothetical protein DL767_008398 [Monosporascus sp. MG133]
MAPTPWPSFVVSARLKAALRQNGIEVERLDAINYKFLHTATTITQMAEALSAIVSQGESHADPAIRTREDPGAFLENPDARAKQIASFQKRGLSKPTEYDERVVFLQTKLAEPNPGSWRLSSFEPQVQAWVNLLHLAAQCHDVPGVLFLSSITAAITTTGRNRTNTSQSVPEAVLGPDKAKGLLQQGYARSKHICERLLEKYPAQPRAGMSAVIRGCLLRREGQKRCRLQRDEPEDDALGRTTPSARQGRAEVVGENPGLKLVDFYKQTLGGEKTEVKVELGNLLSGSEAGRGLPPIQKDHLVPWMQAWGL